MERHGILRQPAARHLVPHGVPHNLLHLIALIPTSSSIASTITAIVITVGAISVVGVPIEILLLLAAILAALSSILATMIVASSIPLSSSRRLPPIHSDQQRHGVVK